MRRRRAKQRPAGWAVALGGALAAGGGLAALVWRKKTAAGAALKKLPDLAARVKPGSGAADSSSAATKKPGGRAEAKRSSGADDSQRQPWHCECGQEYVVSGQDRHQIYWLEGADESDPVLSDNCPNCDRPLPATTRSNAVD